MGNEPPEPFDLTLCSSFVGIDEFYPQELGIILVIGLTMAESVIPNPKDIDLGLLPKPLTRENESGMIINGCNQIHHPHLGKLSLTHDLRLPEIVRVFSYQPL